MKDDVFHAKGCNSHRGSWFPCDCPISTPRYKLGQPKSKKATAQLLLKEADAEFGASPRYWYALLHLTMHNQQAAEGVIQRIIDFNPAPPDKQRRR